MATTKVVPAAAFGAFSDAELQGREPGREGGRTAVLVVHGMGQQTKFDTLQQVADGLRSADGAETRTQNLRIGEQSLSRATLTVDGREVDVFEAYWAPITEGQVKLQDVMSFLYSAAINGIKNAFGRYRRYLFDGTHEVGGGGGTAVVLAFTLLVLLSLVVMNGLTVALGSAHAIKVGPEWVRDRHAVPDVTATIVLFVFVAAAFAMAMVAAKSQKHRAAKRKLPAISRLAFFHFLGTAFTAVAAAVTFGMIVLHHRTPGKWNGLTFTAAAFFAFWSMAFVLFAALICFAAAFGASNAKRRASNVVRTLVLLLFAVAIGQIVTRRMTLGTTVFDYAARQFAAVPLLVWQESTWLGRIISWCADRWMLIWAALAFLSRQVQNFLIQYVGDVAVYVAPNHLDRFNDMRERIKLCVAKTADALYRAKSADGASFLYDRVVIVGHSLGSVVAYDTLNAMLNGDAYSGKRLRVAERTGGLITFGSPLDKTAFLFASRVQDPQSDCRAALAATVQPLVGDPQTREIPWMNVYSPLDIISGHLDFYDSATGEANRVKNRTDWDAITPVAAHTEYWKYPLVWEAVRDGLKRAAWTPEEALPPVVAPAAAPKGVKPS